MEWKWFDLGFPWIGVCAAALLIVLLVVLLIVLLFRTDLLCGDSSSSRWRDPVWLSWLAMVVYLIHDGEEYGIDLFGRLHEFPASICATLKLPADPTCSMPLAFFLAVNLPLFWISAPLSALLSRDHPLVGLTLYGVVFTDALVHIGPALAGQSYSPGTFTAAILFLPVSAWVAYACFGRGRLPYKALTLLVANGVILHVILLSSTSLFIHGVISSSVLVAVQILNAALLVLIPWLAEKWRGGILIRPVKAAAPFSLNKGTAS